MRPAASPLRQDPNESVCQIPGQRALSDSIAFVEQTIRRIPRREREAAADQVDDPRLRGGDSQAVTIGSA